MSSEIRLGDWVRAESDFHAAKGRPGVFLGMDENGIARFGYGGWTATAGARVLRKIPHEEAMKLVREWDEKIARYEQDRVDRVLAELSNEHNKVCAQGDADGFVKFLVKKIIELRDK